MSIELVGKDAPRMLNKLAREEMKELVMRDILCDMAVCEIEGWNKLEYLDDLMATITRLRTGEGGGMSKVKNPSRKCRICGAKCEKQMRFCKLCAREIKEDRQRAARAAI